MKKGSLPPLTTNLAAAIVGIWKLKSREDVDNTGRAHVDPFLGRDPLGVICFGPGHFAAQFMKRDRSRQEDVLHRSQAKNNTAGVNGYDAYFGTYSVDEIAGTLTTHLEGSIAPANIEGVENGAVSKHSTFWTHFSLSGQTQLRHFLAQKGAAFANAGR